MLERVVFHVGPHKTGSTALQTAFATNLRRLESFGIVYPEIGRTGAAHQDTARACWKAYDPLLPKIAREIQDCRVAFFSSELFSALDLEGLRRLASITGGAHVEIIYVMRRLPLLLPSHWRELVKHGQALDFGEYLDYARGQAPRRYLAPPMPVKQLARLRDVFGTEGLRLLVYDARFTDIDDFGPRFVDDVFGLGQVAGKFTTERMNITAPEWQVELVRHMNIIAGTEMNYPTKQKLRHLLMTLIDENPPDWIADFCATYAGAEPITISDQTPFIADAHAHVAKEYRNYFVDPLASYLAPAKSEVRQIITSEMKSELDSEIKNLFRKLSTDIED